VGPVWGDGDEDAKLASAVTGTLRVADERGCESIAMPAISTGIFGFPKDRAASIIYKSINTYFGARGETLVRLVRVVLFDDASVKVFLDIGKRMWEDK
jgi:O-acetyl-ADP-ribose deacetylase (regulator of RNase III)